MYGVAAKLFSVVDESFCQGLSSAAGGKLYNVVVQTEKAGKQILERGRLQKRVTFVPLNKISPYMLNQKKLAAAKRVAGKDNVWWARDLVRFDNEVEPAVNFMFGGLLICRDIDVANKVRSCLTIRT